MDIERYYEAKDFLEEAIECYFKLHTGIEVNKKEELTNLLEEVLGEIYNHSTDKLIN